MVEVKPKSSSDIDRPSFLNGVYVPALLGGGLLTGINITLFPTYPLVSLYVHSAVQDLCGLGVLKQMASRYGRSSVLQSQRLAQLIGVAFLAQSCIGITNVMAVSNKKDASSTLLVSTACFLVMGAAFFFLSFTLYS